MKTYDRDTYLRAKAAWDGGRFGDEWTELRRISWEQGYPYPPTGTPDDDPDAEEPSQRALIYQWLDARPRELTGIARRCRSWSQVIGQVVSMRERLQEDADYSEKDAAWDKREYEPRHGQWEGLGDVLRRL